jgi:lipopolysaccharide/colanic/teichoic acid biosynthesis glycosyltransferase
MSGTASPSAVAVTREPAILPEVPPASLGHRQDVVLRAADVVIAGVTLVVTLPVTVPIAILVRLLDGSPVLYRGVRLGLGGRPFVMYKFRTLRGGAEARLGRLYGDPLQDAARQEVTRVGRVLRPTQLDELPQLVNVLRGDMSMVGPRPLRPTFYAELAPRVPNLWQRFAVRPGLTGFAQVRQENVTPWEEKLAHDLEYVADRSIALYARVCGQTALRILGQVGHAVADEAASRLRPRASRT